MTGTVVFKDIKKNYGTFEAIKGVTLEVRESELLSLLGPSGSGKTTLLMILAGLESAAAGDITVDGKPIMNVPVNKRNLGMVFQRYTLFPHMSVADNVAFPLSIRGMGKAERDEKVRNILDVVRLGDFAHRMPNQLSGGQQQRVALARALVYGPPVVLMDEPFAALDRKLRIEMQEEIRRIREAVGVTIIFVTHDQEEAMRISDRVAIMNDGVLQQVGPAKDIYDAPDNAFVASFIGNTNTIRARIEAEAGDTVVLRADGGGTFTVAKPFWRAGDIQAGKPVQAAIRPEMLQVDPALTANALRTGTVLSTIFLGEGSSCKLLSDGQEIQVSIPFGGVLPRAGETVGLSLLTPSVPVFAA